MRHFTLWIGCLITAASLPLAFLNSTAAAQSQPAQSQPAQSQPAQSQPAQSQPATSEYSPQLYQHLQYRPLGPFRGGRSAAVCGVPGQPMRYYFGATGGGVWQTDDAGGSWTNISDGYFGGSVGAIAVAPSDANVLYVGGGEVTVRGNVSHGNGVWKSEDAGKTWRHVGLEDSRHIPRIRIHPQDPELVYVAALGHLYGPNEQRGIFRSRDGGKSWERILFANDQAGAVDLVLDPSNPRVLYASTWRVRRTPYSLESGGEGSALWKSTDGGDTWTDISRHSGLPGGTWGIVGVAVSPVDPQRVWALVEAEEGGVFRSDNGGQSWRRVNSDRNLRQRAWYYTRIYAGPQNRDELYVLNVAFWRSGDGGEKFSPISTPHSDHHDLWIDPQNAQRMIVADDGGGQVSLNGGSTWSTYMNQPTAQFYRVTTDNAQPYRIYGAQQDNSTVRIRHRSDGYSLGERDWEPTAGGESGFLAPHPQDPDIVYGGSYGGLLERLNHRTGESRLVDVWPDNPIGHGAQDLRYRFQWNFPIFFSPHDPQTLYAAANVLFKTTDEGQSWQAISPDLTRNDPSKLGSSGGPITQDNTSVEYYCTLFAALESPHEAGVLWVGSDDGLVHVSRDAGANWTNVTPKDLPEWAQINSIEADPFQPGGLYVAATRYKLDDFEPYLFHTADYGQSWKRIDAGIDRKHFTRVLRADRKRPGLLFAGTENGLYFSLDNGSSWASLQLNLPEVPITDLAWKDDDLVVATQGRSFWVLDDLTLLHQLKPRQEKEALHLYQPRPLILWPGSGGRTPPQDAGQNPPSGLHLRFWVRDKPEADTAEDSTPTASLEILDESGSLIQRFSSSPREQTQERKLDLEAGMNTVSWNLRHPSAETFPGLVLWGGGTQGPRAIPGMYRVRLTVGAETRETAVQLLPDPRSTASDEDYRLQLQFLKSVRDKLTEIHVAVREIRDIRQQLDQLGQRLKDRDDSGELRKTAAQLRRDLTSVEEALYQTKNESPQDPLNFPIRLNNRLSYLASLAGQGNARPTNQAVQVRDELVQEIDEQLSRFRKMVQEDLPAFNKAVAEKQIPAVFYGDSP